MNVSVSEQHGASFATHEQSPADICAQWWTRGDVVSACCSQRICCQAMVSSTTKAVACCLFRTNEHNKSVLLLSSRRGRKQLEPSCTTNTRTRTDPGGEDFGSSTRTSFSFFCFSSLCSPRGGRRISSSSSSTSVSQTRMLCVCAPTTIMTSQQVGRRCRKRSQHKDRGKVSSTPFVDVIYPSTCFQIFHQPLLTQPLSQSAESF